MIGWDELSWGFSVCTASGVSGIKCPSELMVYGSFLGETDVKGIVGSGGDGRLWNGLRTCVSRGNWPSGQLRI